MVGIYAIKERQIHPKFNPEYLNNNIYGQNIFV